MPVEPKTAAVCILVRGEGEPRVLLAKRNAALRFMAGHHVFPGGRIHDDENTSHVCNAVSAEHARAIQAVAREVFEETGLLCVRGALPAAKQLREARQRLLREEVQFTDMLAEHSLTLDANDFAPAGTWVTPEFSPIRFATQYFLHRVRNDQQEELIDGEIVGLDWLTAREARERWHKGEIRISTPVAYTLRQMAAAELPTALQWLQRGTERVPGEHNWFELRRGITLVPVKSPTILPATHTNCVIVGEEELYIIDPGAEEAHEREHLMRQIDHMVELGGKVAGILLTHSHPDHTAAAEILRARYNAPIMAHPATAAQVAFSIDQSLEDGQVLTSGHDPQWRLQCIFTPGHDPGHLCFLEQSTQALIAGDMIANPGTIVVSRPFGGDMNAFIGSLGRLLELEYKLIIPAHGHPGGSSHEPVQQQLDHRLWRENKIKQAYEAGATTFDELLARAYDDAAPQAMLLARHALDAHLARLGIDLPAQL